MEERDAIAAAARLALLGTSAELAVPFEELKPEIRERWRGVVEVVRGQFWEELDALKVGWANSHKAEEECERLRAELEGVMKSVDTLADRCGFYKEQVDEIKAERDRLNAATKSLSEQLADATVKLATPAGVPSVEELAQAYWVGRDDGTIFNNIRPICKKQTIAGVNAILAALAPYLREPTGWELDVTADDLTAEVGYLAGLTPGESIEVIQYFKERIRPTFECQECAARHEAMMKPQPDVQCAECAKWEKECTQWRNANNELVRRATAANAVLEGRGVPEVKALREIGINAYLMHEQAKRENAGCIVGPMEAAATAIRDAVLGAV